MAQASEHGAEENKVGRRSSGHKSNEGEGNLALFSLLTLFSAHHSRRLAHLNSQFDLFSEISKVFAGYSQNPGYNLLHFTSFLTTRGRSQNP
jgi:hypothetical protein